MLHSANPSLDNARRSKRLITQGKVQEGNRASVIGFAGYRKGVSVNTASTTTSSPLRFLVYKKVR